MQKLSSPPVLELPPADSWIEGHSISDNETLFSLTELPRRFGIVGAGPIGCEIAQAFARFGSAVYLVEAEHGVVQREDRDAAEIIQRSLVNDGVKLLCCGKDLKLVKDPSGTRLQVTSHGDGYDVMVDQVLVAAGRAPNIEGLGVDTVGVEFDKKGVKVNDRLQTPIGAFTPAATIVPLPVHPRGGFHGAHRDPNRRTKPASGQWRYPMPCTSVSLCTLASRDSIRPINVASPPSGNGMPWVSSAKTLRFSASNSSLNVCSILFVVC